MMLIIPARPRVVVSLLVSSGLLAVAGTASDFPPRSRDGSEADGLVPSALQAFQDDSALDHLIHQRSHLAVKLLASRPLKAHDCEDRKLGTGSARTFTRAGARATCGRSLAKLTMYAQGLCSLC